MRRGDPALAAANGASAVLGAELRPDAADPIESAFALVLEDFASNNGWHQERLLDPAQARATLSALARTPRSPPRRPPPETTGAHPGR